LKSQGMAPRHKLLEIGCGTGRLARKASKYLHMRKYYGLDISEAAIANCRELSQTEGWADRDPTFWVGELPPGRSYDYIWAFSVAIHLPLDVWTEVLQRTARSMTPESKFFYSYVPEPKAWRSGVKQFRNTLQEYQQAAKNAGLSFSDVPNWMKVAGYEQGRWSGSQKVALSQLA
jgi:cyclopropane fatty-acyl-phospholipid synthase-like methyltransferase